MSTQKASEIRRSVSGSVGTPPGCPLVVGAADSTSTRTRICRLPAGLMRRSSLVGRKDGRQSVPLQVTGRQPRTPSSQAVGLQGLVTIALMLPGYSASQSVPSAPSNGSPSTQNPAGPISAFSFCISQFIHEKWKQ